MGNNTTTNDKQLNNITEPSLRGLTDSPFYENEKQDIFIPDKPKPGKSNPNKKDEKNILDNFLLKIHL